MAQDIFGLQVEGNLQFEEYMLVPGISSIVEMFLSDSVV